MVVSWEIDDVDEDEEDDLGGRRLCETDDGGYSFRSSPNRDT